mmetsp:Transcript_37700/g.112883  ORF Transcript_37700/g.112883 Transcript_37700/m.112883 type:complete len:87 (-) Transcript_37700:91-351(-)
MGHEAGHIMRQVGGGMRKERGFKRQGSGRERVLEGIRIRETRYMRHGTRGILNEGKGRGQELGGRKRRQEAKDRKQEAVGRRQVVE